MAIVQAARKELEDLLKETDYDWLNTKYKPSLFALEFITFIKLVNGGEGEENKSPNIHMDMIDQVVEHDENLFVSFRGSAKALSLDTNLITPSGTTTMKSVCVGDTLFDMNGKKTTVTHKSVIFNKPMYKLVLNDGREMKVSEDHINIVRKKSSGGKFIQLNMTTKELINDGLWYSRKVSCRNPSGKETKWFIPNNKIIEYSKKEIPLDPYTVGVILGDGNIGKDGYTRIHSHIDDVEEIKSYIPYRLSELGHDKRNEKAVRFSIYGISKSVKSFIGTNNCYSKNIPSDLMIGSVKQRTELLRGLMDTDGTIYKNGSIKFSSTSFELAHGVSSIVRSLGGRANMSKKENSHNGSYDVNIIIDINPFKLKRKRDRYSEPKTLKHVHTGILDIVKIDNEPSQCISVDSDTKSFLGEDYIVTHNTTALHEYMFLYLATYGKIPKFGSVNVAMYVSDTIDNGVKSMRQNLEFRWQKSEFLQKYVPYARFTDVRWEFGNADGKKLCVRGFGASTGVRGFKEYGQRPTWCGFDDLMSDKNAESATITKDIRNIIYKAARQALHPRKRKINWTGTPFNKKDPLYDAAGSPGWNTRCYPICEKFPCTREEFKGGWEDRFGYDFVKNEYDKLLASGEIAAFNQELMLRIISDDDRLVQDGDIVRFDRNKVLQNKSRYNWYITTDFATSEKESADFSVISVWAHSSNGDWMWCDGIVKRQTMDKNIDDLFRFVQMYNPLSVGIEITGQQGGFISWARKEMLNRNIYFNLASNSGGEGLRPTTNKMVRFQGVLPMFKMKKIWFPEDMDDSPEMIQAMDELKNVSAAGFKSKHDDFSDTISMLLEMKAIKPSGYGVYDIHPKKNKVTNRYEAMFGDDFDSELTVKKSSYIC